MAIFPYPVDILIAYNAYADIKTYQKLYGTTDTTRLPCIIIGPQYAPLREMFQNIEPRQQNEVVKNVLISTGGADFLHLALQFLRHSLPGDFTYHLLIGSLNTDKEELKKLAATRNNVILHENVSDMRGLLSQMDMAISAAGSTLYEIAACGVPLITYVLADNQIEGAEAFSRLDLAVNVGDLRKRLSSPVDTILDAVNYLSSSPNNYEVRKTMGKLEQQIVDGRGAERIVNMIVNILTAEQNIQKLYILYIPKHYGKESLLPQVIGDFLQKRKKQFTVVISPGFLGDKADFIKNMASKFKGYVSELEFYRGMGTRNKNGIELLQYNEQGFRYSLSVPVIPHMTKKDHRKMIFFNTLNQPTATAQVDINIAKQLETSAATFVQTEAILLGSSNFSYKTYFGKGKGEADVFLFYDKIFATYCRGAILDEGVYADCVLSESIAMKRTETPQSYLNLIYDEFRKHA